MAAISRLPFYLRITYATEIDKSSQNKRGSQGNCCCMADLAKQTIVKLWGNGRLLRISPEAWQKVWPFGRVRRKRDSIGAYNESPSL